MVKYRADVDRDPIMDLLAKTVKKMEEVAEKMKKVCCYTVAGIT